MKSKLRNAKKQSERWILFKQAKTEGEKELVLQEILENARNEGEIMRVHKLAPINSKLEKDALYLLGGAQDPVGLAVP